MTMKMIRGLCSCRPLALALVLAGIVVTAGAATTFALPAPPLELVQDEAKFAPFAREVSAKVEQLLGDPAAVDDPGALAMLLSTRVHLAHHFSDNEKAIATAAWIRSRQTDPAGRAFAGLTTLASVEARRRHPGSPPTDAAYRATFRAEFDRRLAALPRTPEMTAFLRGQRQKIAEITEAALLAETRDVIAPAIARRGHCGLAEADQLVRVRHRLLGILPVRGETLAALDAAITARENNEASPCSRSDMRLEDKARHRGCQSSVVDCVVPNAMPFVSITAAIP